MSCCSTNLSSMCGHGACVHCYTATSDLCSFLNHIQAFKKESAGAAITLCTDIFHDCELTKGLYCSHLYLACFRVQIVHVTALCFDDSFANPPPSLTELHQV